MIIVAKFIGENSLGYKKGKIYRLIIVGNVIRRFTGDCTGVCPYSSIVSFLKNWLIINQE